MGVTGLFAKFVKTHSPSSVLSSRPTASKTRGLCFDLNGTLHPIAQEVFMYRDGCKTDEQLTEKKVKRQKFSFEELEYQFLEKLNKTLSELIAYFDPYEFIIIAVDGIPPLAKIDLQRRRRLGGFLDSTSTAVSITLEEKEKNTPLAGFDISFISPGTPFMEKIHNYILVFLKNNMNKWRANTVVYTSYKEPGEGEHKIFKRLREQTSLEEGNFYDPANKDSVIIWGLDGDLLILSTVSPTAPIYMCRESLNEFVNVDSFKSDLKINPFDFCVISNLIGNDFLPKNTIYATYVQDEVFAAYLKVKKVFEDSGNCCLTYYKEKGVVIPEININYLFSFLKELSKYEADLATGIYFYQQKNKGRLYRTSSILERAFDTKTNKVDMQKYDEIVLNDIRTIHFPASSADDLVLTDALKNSIAFNYINAILWMYSYYTKGGDSVNWNFKYPFLIAPSVGFVVRTILTAENFISNRPKNVYKDEEETPYESNGISSLSLGELLLIITPPKNLKKMFEKKYEYTDLSEKYFFAFLKEGDVKIYDDGKEKEHLREIVLPPIDVKAIKENLLNEYGLKIKKYETENAEKIKNNRINDFEKNRNLAAVNERVLKSKLHEKIEYRHRTPLYEDGDYVYFQRIKKPPFVIPSELASADFRDEKDAVVVSVKNLSSSGSKKKDFTRSEIREVHASAIEKIKKEKKVEDPFLKSFLEQFKLEGIKSGF